SAGPILAATVNQDDRAVSSRRRYRLYRPHRGKTPLRSARPAGVRRESWRGGRGPPAASADSIPTPRRPNFGQLLTPPPPQPFPPRQGGLRGGGRLRSSREHGAVPRDARRSSHGAGALGGRTDRSR